MKKFLYMSLVFLGIAMNLNAQWVDNEGQGTTEKASTDSIGLGRKPASALAGNGWLWSSVAVEPRAWHTSGC